MEPVVAEPAAKRARIEVKPVPFNQLDLDKFSLKTNVSKKDGKTYYNTLVDGSGILVNLTPEKQSWLDTPFGFDTSCKFEVPSFLGGEAPKKDGATEGLSLRLNLQPEQADFLRKLDAAAQKAFADIATATWNPLITEDAFRNTTACKVLVALRGANLTKLTIVHDGQVTCGCGWDFLEKFLMDSNNCRQAEVKLTIKVQKVYNVAKKAGMKLEATQMCLRLLGKPVEEDVFADHAALLA
jgi:hypothetical protein